MDGGAGTDTASYAGATERVGIRLRDTSFQSGEASGDVLINIEEGTVGLNFDWLSDAKLVLTDELITEMLRQRKAAGDINEDEFDEIETDETPLSEEK